MDEFWIPSEYVRRVYVESGVPAEKVFVVPNGVDAEKFHPQVAPMKLSTAKKFKFLFVGGTIGRKGPDLLLQAYLKNFTAADDVCLVIKDFGGQSVYTGQTFEAQIRAAQALPNAPEILYLNAELAARTTAGTFYRLRLSRHAVSRRRFRPARAGGDGLRSAAHRHRRRRDG